MLFYVFWKSQTRRALPLQKGCVCWEVWGIFSKIERIYAFTTRARARLLLVVVVLLVVVEVEEEDIQKPKGERAVEIYAHREVDEDGVVQVIDVRDRTDNRKDRRNTGESQDDYDDDKYAILHFNEAKYIRNYP